MSMSVEMSPDDSFKRPGTVPFKWEIQPGVPKHSYPAPSPSASPKLQPPPSRARLAARTASASPTNRRSLPSRSASPLASPSPSWKLPAAPVVSHGCFPAASPIKRRDERSKAKSSPQAAGRRSATPTRSSFSFSALLGGGSPQVAEEWERPRRSVPGRSSPAFSGPLGRSPRVAQSPTLAHGRSSPAFLSPVGRYSQAAEEAVSAARWLF